MSWEFTQYLSLPSMALASRDGCWQHFIDPCLRTFKLIQFKRRRTFVEEIQKQMELFWEEERICLWSRKWYRRGRWHLGSSTGCAHEILKSHNHSLASCPNRPDRVTQTSLIQRWNLLYCSLPLELKLCKHTRSHLQSIYAEEGRPLTRRHSRLPFRNLPQLLFMGRTSCSFPFVCLLKGRLNNLTQHHPTWE